MADIFLNYVIQGEVDAFLAAQRIERQHLSLADAVRKLANETEANGESMAQMTAKMRGGAETLRKMKLAVDLTGISFKDLAVGVLKAAKHIAVDFTRAGAVSIDIATRFAKVAGAAGIDLDRFRESVAGAFDDTNLQRIALIGEGLGLTGKQLEDLGGIARAFSNKTGADLQTTLEGLVNAAGTGETGELKKIASGIGEMGAIASAAGVKVEELTGAQRANLIVTELNRRTTDLVAQNSLPSLAEGHNRAKASLDNFISSLQEQAARFVEDNDLIEVFTETLAALKPVTDLIIVAFELLAPALQVVLVTIKALVATIQWLVDVVKFLLGNVKDMTIAFVDQSAAADDTATSIGKTSQAAKQLAATEARLALAVNQTTDALAAQGRAEKARTAAAMASFQFLTTGTSEFLKEGEDASKISSEVIGQRAALASRLASEQQHSADKMRPLLREQRKLADALASHNFADSLIETSNSAEEAKDRLGEMTDRLLELQDLTGKELRFDGGKRSLIEFQDEAENTIDFVFGASEAGGEKIAKGLKKGIVKGLSDGDLREGADLIRGFILAPLTEQFVTDRLMEDLREGAPRLMTEAERVARGLMLTFENGLAPFGELFSSRVSDGFQQALDDMVNDTIVNDKLLEQLGGLGSVIESTQGQVENLKGSFTGEEANEIGEGFLLTLGNMNTLTSGILNNYGSIVEGMSKGKKGIQQATEGITSVLGTAAKAGIKDAKAQAVVMGILETANAAASVAAGILGSPLHFVKAAAHVFAAGQYFSLAGGGGGKSSAAASASAGAAKKKKAADRPRPELQLATQSTRRDERSSNSTVYQVFQFGSGESGQAIAGALNTEIQRNRGTVIDGSIRVNL